mmetsp:Transcript_9978/g.14124  ORF Transcript_9978/g.14124 Transcript_9978/m.14124 type:complete len:259 (-) Transcript_9978:57-833(-)|eukprot:CAMPEP_0184860276 /NCGR_PEP_ID=MMETSP0580-20130426/5194_1 /TAXON_ID=1118495 /ORGANISM="Dactyliosolen fragilissimus" /LENGTH=258 /DNA_ID=CAMNT_0027357321 /DNA_START=35 /DNA_END=811 /DNA_ORIENTATION=+
MARPEEKAQAMLNKWTKMREQGDNYGEIQASLKRPYLASLCEHLHDAEKFRRQIIREISDSVSKIQNAGLGEHAIRDLNDKINKLLREKYHWNRRILELNGPNYNRIERMEQLAEGDDQTNAGLVGSGGYRYFGAAKDLPGVKELFIRRSAKLNKRKRGDIYKYITPDYYGLRDEEDGVLLHIEKEASKKRKDALEKKRQEIRKFKEFAESDDEYEGTGGVTGAADAIASHIAMPTQEIVKQTVLKKKKQELLQNLTL